jgi:membrane-associated protein
LLSDHIGFYLGRWLGPRFHHHPFAIKRAKQLQKSEAFILKYGAAAIILGRLMTAVRSLVPMLVGISGTSRVTFSVIDVAACVIWSLGLGGLVIGLDNLLPG